MRPPLEAKNGKGDPCPVYCAICVERTPAVVIRSAPYPDWAYDIQVSPYCDEHDPVDKPVNPNDYATCCLCKDQAVVFRLSRDDAWVVDIYCPKHDPGAKTS